MIAVKKENGFNFKKIVLKMDNNRKSPKVKFEAFGEEMIEKEVKHNGNSGRVYLPPEWVGKHVKPPCPAFGGVAPRNMKIELRKR
jgi:hypothetical protein